VAEAGGALLAMNEKEQLLLELFPSVATKFLRNKRIEEWKAAHPEEAAKAEASAAVRAAGMAAGSAPGGQEDSVLSIYESADYEPADGESPEFWEEAPGWAGG